MAFALSRELVLAHRWRRSIHDELIRLSGIGIPRKHHVKVFDRFYRVPRGEQTAPGSGLGLSITKWIAEAHDGIIDVKSREKRGSTFIVTLPLALSSHTQPASS